MKKLLLSAMFAATLLPMSARHLEFPTDSQQRGYYTRPWLRYEAEDGIAESWQGDILLPAAEYSQKDIQAEASRGSALMLSGEGDYVEWVCDEDADGLTLRFSLPDSPDGQGLKSSLALYSGDKKICDISLDSYWAWQYTVIANATEKYPDNIPADSKFARMRFDEVNVLLPEAVSQGESFRLVKEAADGVPCIVDFVELEKVPAPVRFEDISGEKVLYQGDGSTLQSVINVNGGKTIFIPEGKYNIARRITINAPGTKIVGAGMWYTILNFNTPSDKRSTYMQRGFESNADNLLFSGFSMLTANNKRYFENNSNYQVGKGFNGSLGKGSVIRDVRVEHFECGAWIADYSGTRSENLTVEHCRFRNNYADGINLSSGTTGARVAYCSFRGNGDDDMASWSSNNMASGNEFAYCTSENNWRASGLGFFGGSGNHAHHIYVADGMEEGVRVNGEFAGVGFGDTTLIEDVTIERCGDKSGRAGEHGGFWGSACPSLHIRGGWATDVKALSIKNVDILDSRWRGVNFSCNGSKRISGVSLENINVRGVGNYEWALYVESSAVGDAVVRNLSYSECQTPAWTNDSRRFTLDLAESSLAAVETSPFDLRINSLRVLVGNLAPGCPVHLYHASGMVAGSCFSDFYGNARLCAPCGGIYFLKCGSHPCISLSLK